MGGLWLLVVECKTQLEMCFINYFVAINLFGVGGRSGKEVFHSQGR